MTVEGSQLFKSFYTAEIHYEKAKVEMETFMDENEGLLYSYTLMLKEVNDNIMSSDKSIS